MGCYVTQEIATNSKTVMQPKETIIDFSHTIIDNRFYSKRQISLLISLGEAC